MAHKKGDRMAVLVKELVDCSKDDNLLTDYLDLMDWRSVDLDRNYHYQYDEGGIAVIECVRPSGGYFEDEDGNHDGRIIPGIWKIVTE